MKSLKYCLQWLQVRRLPFSPLPQQELKNTPVLDAVRYRPYRSSDPPPSRLPPDALVAYDPPERAHLARVAAHALAYQVGRGRDDPKGRWGRFDLCWRRSAGGGEESGQGLGVGVAGEVGDGEPWWRRRAGGGGTDDQRCEGCDGTSVELGCGRVGHAQWVRGCLWREPREGRDVRRLPLLHYLSLQAG